jgi:hypothetical protein
MVLKAKGLIFLIVLSIAGWAMGCGSIQTEGRLETYENQFMEMEYPAEWTYEEIEDESFAAVRFEEEGEGFVFEMSISRIENWLTEEEKLNMMEDIALEQSEEQGFEILENEEIQIDGHSGLKIIDQHPDRGRRKTIATVFNYHQLAINFSGSEEAYETHKETVNEMIESIEIIRR